VLDLKLVRWDAHAPEPQSTAPPVPATPVESLA
jgi:hypothetical protein